FSVLLETEINDILENHRLKAGLLTSIDLRDGDLFAEYQYLKYWMDFYVRFNRSSYLFEPRGEGDITQKYIRHQIETGASVPLSNTFRFELSPFYSNTIFSNLQHQYVIGTPNLGFANDRTVHYGGGRLAAVLDNTTARGFNIQQGTRALIEYE